MPIKVRYEPDIKTMAQLAYGVGKGEKRRYDIKRADILAFQAAQLRETAAGRKDRFNLASRGLQQQITERAISRDFEREMFGREADVRRDVSQRNLASQLAIGDVTAERALIRDEARFGQDISRLSFQDELTKGRVIFEYTQQQKREMEKAAQGLAYIQGEKAAGRMTQDTFDNMRSQLEAMLTGTEPVPKYDDTPTGQQRFKEASLYHPETDTWWVNEGNGRWKQIEPKTKTDEIPFKDYSSLYLKQYDSMKTSDALGNDILPDPLKVATQTQSIIADYNRYMGGDTAGVSQEQVSGIAADMRNNTQDYFRQRIREGATQSQIAIVKQALEQGATDEQLATLDRLLRGG